MRGINTVNRATLLMMMPLSIAISSPANAAMNWCSLPLITPKSENDFEKLAPLVEGQSGCKRQNSDSAHSAKWVCEDDPTTVDAIEQVHVILDRSPGEGIRLIVISVGMQNLDKVRQCPNRDLRNGKRFDAGNALIRDQISIGLLGPTLTLTNIGPEFLSVIASDKDSYTVPSEYTKGLWYGVHGITTVAYPTTTVKLAGLSPIESNVYALVEAFEKRGSSVTASDELGGTSPEWTLSPPLGLAGVTSVKVVGFVEHMLRTEYLIATTDDYERYIALLDSEYGKSERSVDGTCTRRNWESGRIFMIGKHCPSGEKSLIFYNEVASDQLDQVVTKFEKDKADQPNIKVPAIDADMF